MATIKKLEHLKVWNEARLLCKIIYCLTESLPNSEIYNIKKHLMESARGTVANIGEGFGRYYFKDSLRFYGIARGCLNEVKSDITISFDVGYLQAEKYRFIMNQIDKTEALLNGLAKNILYQLSNYPKKTN